MVYKVPKMSSPKMQILRVSSAEKAGREALEKRGLVHVKPGTENSWKEYVEKYYGLPLLVNTVGIMEELTLGRSTVEIITNTENPYSKFLGPRSSSSVLIIGIIKQCHQRGEEFAEKCKPIFEGYRAGKLAGARRA